MPDCDGDTKADAETILQTSLHAYQEGRKDDIKGDNEATNSSQPNAQGEADKLQLPAQRQ